MPLGEKKALTNFIKYLNTFSLKQQPLDASVRVKDVLHSDVKFQNVLSSPKRNMNYRIPDFVKLFGDMKINVRPNNEHPDRKKWKMRNTAVKSVRYFSFYFHRLLVCLCCNRSFEFHVSSCWYYQISNR